MSLAQELEQRAVLDWPAVETQHLGPWQLRFSHGLTLRGNSVAAFAQLPQGPLDRALDEVEQRYAAHTLPPCFQLFDHAPAELEARLAARGYATQMPTAVQVAACRPPQPRAGSGAVQGSVLLAPEPAWRQLAIGHSRFADHEAGFLGFCERLGGRARYALACRAGEPIGAGLGVLSERWLGIYAMITAPEARRHGAARAVVAALFACARAQGVEQAYLLVEQSNAPALALYAGLGFATVATYRYRLPAQPPSRERALC